MTMYGRIFDTPSVAAPGEIGWHIAELVPVPAIQMIIRLEWAVRNSGDADAYAALKVHLIETKAWRDDVDWVTYTPLAREGGPGLVDDIFAKETASKTAISAPLTLIRPGMTEVARVALTIPGTLMYKSFWYAHSTPTFKIVVQALHITPDYEYVADLKGYTFDEAFRMTPALVGKLEALSTHAGVAQPTLYVSSM